METVLSSTSVASSGFLNLNKNFGFLYVVAGVPLVVTIVSVHETTRVSRSAGDVFENTFSHSSIVSAVHHSGITESASVVIFIGE